MGLWAAALGAAIGTPCLALTQQPNDVPSLGRRVTIESSVLDEARTLWVWTPPGYSETGPGLPVLYLLDPDIHYRHVTALVQFLSLYLRAPEMLVVGVVNTSRTRDFTPAPPAEGSGPAPGGADRFRRFLVEEVQPHIQRTYRTAPFSMLIGHSLGGLFALHTAVGEPGAFAAYVAVSPSLYWADSLVLRSARSAIERRADLPRFLFLGLAGNEPPNIAATTRQLSASLARASPPRLQWESAEFPGENHLTVPLPAFRDAIRWLFADWPISIEGTAARIVEERSLAAFDEHFERLSRRFGYSVQPTELTISIVGDRLYRREAFDQAIALFAKRVTLYPESPEAHDELARGYEAAGQLAPAVASYERALALAEAQRHPSLDAIRERLARARGVVRER